MAGTKTGGDSSRRFGFLVLCALVVIGGLTIFTFRLTRNPAGFFVDESSIAYNAFTISVSGQDEFGNSWPLYFRAFGDYKNPVYVYLMAGLFKITGPSILTARLLGVLAGLAAALLLGLLARRIAGQRHVGLILAASALLTPWWFEISRVSMEVALYPLVLVLFLWCAHRAASRPKWNWTDVLGLVTTLGLLTFTYSIGRLLAPLLALGLLFLVSRRRLVGLLLTWAGYGLLLIPLFIFQREHNDALTGRFKMISYVSSESSTGEIIWTFFKHYAGNLDPRSLLWSGDPNIYQVAHVANNPALLVATFALIVFGVWLIVRHRLNNAWWRFVCFGLAVSLIPASLTVDYFHMLRLVPLLVFLLLLTIPALELLTTNKSRWRQPILITLIALTFAQGAVFQWRYHQSAGSPWRLHLFDASFSQIIFTPALAQSTRPIYLADPVPTAYIQSYWYGVLNQFPVRNFVMLKPDESPPMGALVISTEHGCDRPKVLAYTEPYTLYIVDRPPRPRLALAERDMRAEISVANVSRQAFTGEQLKLDVHIKNQGSVVWGGCERNAGPKQVSLAGRWLNQAGEALAGGEGRTVVPADIGPAQEANLIYVIDAPRQSGEYVLELDMLQEGVAWFGLKGSKTWRGVFTVK